MTIDHKDIWIKTGYETFALDGKSGLKIEPLAKKVGISKSSFYHHFVDLDKESISTHQLSGGLFDIEFSDHTKPFFYRVEKGEIKIVYSEITTDELADFRNKDIQRDLTWRQKQVRSRRIFTR